MRKKIVNIFAKALGLDGYWVTRKLLTKDQKEIRKKISVGKFRNSKKGQANRHKYQKTAHYKKLRKKYQEEKKKLDVW